MLFSTILDSVGSKSQAKKSALSEKNACTHVHNCQSGHIDHLISRSSTCSDNHNERGKVLERHKVTSAAAQPKMKIDKAKTFKYMSRVPNTELKIMTDSNFIN